MGRSIPPGPYLGTITPRHVPCDGMPYRRNNRGLVEWLCISIVRSKATSSQIDVALTLVFHTYYVGRNRISITATK